MNSIVISKTGEVKPVKNLGWLVRHASAVRRVLLSNRNDGARCGCALHAFLNDGRVYYSAFNSLQICREWIKRPSLRHAEITDAVTELSATNP